MDIHLKVDTGMGRLGIWFENFDECLNLISGMKLINLSGVYTHFSDPINDPEFTFLQRQRMQNLLDSHLLPSGLKVHADNSASFSELYQYPVFNAVRIGLLQYGVLPYEQCEFAELNISPTLSFYTKIGLLKKIPKATSIIRDQLCPILGQITMDQIIVDVSQLEAVDAGETVTLIGSSKNHNISLEAFSKKSNTIPWEILCSITKRVNRVYINPRG